MNYDNKAVRRQDRLLDEERAQELLRTAEYGVLSMADSEGHPYGLPLNYVWDGDSTLYVHCAPEGKKLHILAANPHASFCVVGRTHLLPSHFTTEYESIVLEGCASLVENEEEKRCALRLLIEKLAPNDVEAGLRNIEKSLHRTAIIRMEVKQWSGKRKQKRS